MTRLIDVINSILGCRHIRFVCPTKCRLGLGLNPVDALENLIDTEVDDFVDGFWIFSMIFLMPSESFPVDTGQPADDQWQCANHGGDNLLRSGTRFAFGRGCNSIEDVVEDFHDLGDLLFDKDDGVPQCS